MEKLNKDKDDRVYRFNNAIYPRNLDYLYTVSTLCKLDRTSWTHGRTKSTPAKIMYVQEVDPFYIVGNCIKGFKTSWTYSTIKDEITW